MTSLKTVQHGTRYNRARLKSSQTVMLLGFTCTAASEIQYVTQLDDNILPSFDRPQLKFTAVSMFIM